MGLSPKSGLSICCSRVLDDKLPQFKNGAQVTLEQAEVFLEVMVLPRLISTHAMCRELVGKDYDWERLELSKILQTFNIKEPKPSTPPKVEDPPDPNPQSIPLEQMPSEVYVSNAQRYMEQMTQISNQSRGGTTRLSLQSQDLNDDDT